MKPARRRRTKAQAFGAPGARGSDSRLVVDHQDVRGCRIAYVERGAGEPIVFLHGISASLHYYRRNLGHFARSMRAIALDAPGFGESDAPDVPYSIPWMARQITHFLEARDVGPATLVGNSMGGLIAMAMALHHPERVRRLVLVNSAGISHYPRPLLIAGQRIARGVIDAYGDRMGRWMFPPLLHAAFSFVYPARPDLAWRTARAYRAGLSDAEFSDRVRTFLSASRGILEWPVHERAAAIDVPTLIIWGGLDVILPRTMAWRLQKLIRGSDLHIYATGGHCPMVDQSERFNRDVAAFIAGTP